MTQVLTQRQINRSVLARQLLLQPLRIPVHRAVERLAGVQAQYAPSPYIGLWSRLEGFERSDLTGALHRGSVVQGTLMRGTIHLVSRRDYWAMASAVGDARRQWWIRLDKGRHSELDIRWLAKLLTSALRQGPRRRAELMAALEIDAETWSGVVNWVDLVRVPPSGTWDSRRADLYGLAEELVGESRLDPASGTDLLIRRYLAGFGPASRGDIKAFAGLSLSTIDESLNRSKTRMFASEEGGLLFDVPEGQLPDDDVPAPVRFIGTWDAILLVHARRSGVLPEEYRPRIFDTKIPHSYPTFMVDGSVRGTWREEGGKVLLQPFEPIPARFRDAIEDESARLAAFLV